MHALDARVAPSSNSACRMRATRPLRGTSRHFWAGSRRNREKLWVRLGPLTKTHCPCPTRCCSTAECSAPRRSPNVSPPRWAPGAAHHCTSFTTTIPTSPWHAAQWPTRSPVQAARRESAVVRHAATSWFWRKTRRCCEGCACYRAAPKRAARFTLLTGPSHCGSDILCNFIWCPLYRIPRGSQVN